MLQRFPQIPASIRDHPIIAELATTFGPQLLTANKPSNCAAHQMTREHRVYVHLISPLEVLSYGFIRPEQSVARLRAWIEHFARDPHECFEALGR
jgi:hypothetical protein